jgi:hypothetical protein
MRQQLKIKGLHTISTLNILDKILLEIQVWIQLELHAEEVACRITEDSNS